MGNAQSLQPLTTKEIISISNKFHCKLQVSFESDTRGISISLVTQDGVNHYHNLYVSLLTGLKKEYSDEEERLQIWFIEKSFFALFPKALETPNAVVTFSDYLEVLFKWRAQTPDERLDFFFNLLDYNQDGVLTPSDLSIFIQQSLGYICQVGDQVRIRDDNREGVLAYVGSINIQNVTGKFAGINLTKPLGKNNGTLEGKKYFEAKDNHGVFVEFSTIELEQHHKQGEHVIELLGGKGSVLTKDHFIAKCINDKWLLSRLNLDPVNKAYLKQ